MDPRAVLSLPSLYRLYQGLVGGRRARRLFVQRIVRPGPGERILDIGCGPGDILDFLPDVDYTGIDPDPDYVSAARRAYGPRGTFLCARVEDLAIGDPGAETVPPDSFDVVIAAGVIHHLDDGGARALFRAAARGLRPGGRLVTLDGCFEENQHPLSRLLLRLDRGEHVRSRDAYEALARETFDRVETRIEEGLLHVPYTLIVMECRSSQGDRMRYPGPPPTAAGAFGRA